MTLKRRAAKLKNKFKKSNSKYVILIGSENGGTLTYANAFQQQLIAAGESVYIAELNKYSKFKNAEHIIVMTSTYGEGEAPTNANKFLNRLNTIQQKQNVSYSVVGFGSLAYPDFCKFAFDVDAAFLLKDYSQLLPMTTINDKSFENFEQWVRSWSKKVGLQLSIPKENLVSKPRQLKSFVVVSKSNVKENPDDTFMITLKPKQQLHFTSGDLLAVFPRNDYQERLYSVGKVDGNVHLSVKYYDKGLGSNFLNNFEVGDTFKARLIENAHFHFPKKASKVIMIANGTGIAPFLGMLNQNHSNIDIDLYLGLRTEKSFKLYESKLQENINSEKLRSLNLAYSQQDERLYVQHLLKRDGEKIANHIENNSNVMICGSLAMYKDVMEILNDICLEFNKKSLSHYSKQIKADCY